ncbi:MAG: toxin RelE [Nitrospirales bacterium]|nr:MAG: toxin RelE [Nitrospirales bacterium]
MHAVVETDEYLRQAKHCRITDAERESFIDFIADHPSAGKEISGTGGVRKVRFPKPGMGKSGGYRVVTFYSGENIPVFLLSVFAKSDKTTLTQAEKNSLRSTMGELVKTYHVVKEKQS